ncbi:MAG: HAMP domain-containing sensor histidine kinase [Campylobacterota bacterium]|nr:HAMP domain-containing sensor histidine kinase [Campylobacterota bacterium]
MIDKIDKNQLDIERLNSNLANKIEEEVEKNRKKDQILFQQSRLAQMGEMIGMIAHQWRQPLAAIGSTNASLELKATLDKLDNEIVIKHAKSISQYTQHLSSTIDDFRSFFKPDKIKKETSLEDVVSVSLNIIETSIANKNISIIKELNSKERFKTYPNELKQVVLNLLKNAEEILIERSIENPTIKIIANHNSLIISDNGGGVPEDIIDKIFDPYFSTKLSKNGTGLGLYMSKTIVDEHCGAKLSVANDKDGASFSILL